MTYEFRHYAYLGREGAEIASRPAKLLHDYRFFLSAFPVPHTVAAMGLVRAALPTAATRNEGALSVCLPAALHRLYGHDEGHVRSQLCARHAVPLSVLRPGRRRATRPARDALARPRSSLRDGLLLLCVFILLPIWRQAVAVLPQVRLRGEDTRSLAMKQLASRFPGQRLAVLAELHVHPEDLARAPSTLSAQHSGPLVVSISDLDAGALRTAGIRWLLTAPARVWGVLAGSKRSSTCWPTVPSRP